MGFFDQLSAYLWAFFGTGFLIAFIIAFGALVAEMMGRSILYAFLAAGVVLAAVLLLKEGGDLLWAALSDEKQIALLASGAKEELLASIVKTRLVGAVFGAVFGMGLWMKYGESA
ncbi:hypothetical protein NK214_11920 [Chromobacterium sp. S0633]|uniref:hypothetical protein n=1 Tax=Chromobacterium sp. S0633 TaxID=2957805 RepID=UPI0020A074D8|nr:hypothetical protein [Chromobacterium sp. S0633]MCP1290896.1 hypothetical protein [Chromobacterium sp. S0633]